MVKTIMDPSTVFANRSHGSRDLAKVPHRLQRLLGWVGRGIILGRHLSLSELGAHLD